MVDDAKTIDKSVRLVLNSIIGGKIAHVSLFMNNGFSIVVEKGRKQYALNVSVPDDVPLDDCLETMTYDI